MSSIRRQSLRAAARRLAGRVLPGPLSAPGAAVIARLDRLPIPVPVILGLVPAAALGWLALKSPAVLGLILLLLPVVVYRQGQRIRVLWEGEGAMTPAEPLRPVPSPTPPAAPSPPPPTPPYRVQDRLIEMIELPGGSFRMGSDQARKVRISPFAMGRTPVTRALYRSLVKEVPGSWGRDQGDEALPANYVSWEDAVRFCNALSERSGLAPCYRQTDAGWACDWAADGYRLPTEAEWEYACRAGTETPWFWGKDEKDAARYAWFSGNSGYKTHPVGEKLANPWGLHDLAGNCWEWCWDWYASPYDPSATVDPRGPDEGQGRMLRGGSSVHGPWLLRSAVRDGGRPETRDGLIGLRCVRGSNRQPIP